MKIVKSPELFVNYCRGFRIVESLVQHLWRDRTCPLLAFRFLCMAGS